MKKIIFAGLSIVVLYSILVCAYGFDCQGPLNSSTYYQLDSGVTPNDNVSYYVGCALDEVAPDVRIIVTDLKTGTKVVDVLDYNVRYSNHYFDALNDRSYSVYIGSGSTVGWALCEPAN